jgi:hypothetical protein
MKKELLQKINKLSCFVLNDNEYNKLQKYLLLEDYTSARIYLDKIIDDTEFLSSFNDEDIESKSKIKHIDELMDLVIELILINERENEREQVRMVTE